MKKNISVLGTTYNTTYTYVKNIQYRKVLTVDSIVRLQLSAQVYSQVASCILIYVLLKIKKNQKKSQLQVLIHDLPQAGRNTTKGELLSPKKTKLAQPSRHISAKLILYPAGRLPHVAVPILPTPHCLHPRTTNCLPFWTGPELVQNGPKR